MLCATAILVLVLKTLQNTAARLLSDRKENRMLLIFFIVEFLRRGSNTFVTFYLIKAIKDNLQPFLLLQRYVYISDHSDLNGTIYYIYIYKYKGASVNLIPNLSVWK